MFGRVCVSSLARERCGETRQEAAVAATLARRKSRRDEVGMVFPSLMQEDAPPWYSNGPERSHTMGERTPEIADATGFFRITARREGSQDIDPLDRFLTEVRFLTRRKP